MLPQVPIIRPILHAKRSDLPEEEEMDPFYSVNKLTGEFKEFSIFSDDNIDYIVPLFK